MHTAQAKGANNVDKLPGISYMSALCMHIDRTACVYAQNLKKRSQKDDFTESKMTKNGQATSSKLRTE